MKERNPRFSWRTGLVAALLPLAMGSTAQDAVPLRGEISRPQPAASLPQPLPAAGVAGTASAVPASALDVARFEAIASALVANGRIPGLAMAIVKNGKILSARGYGITDVNQPQPVDAHTVFRLASLSKSFAATMTGILVNDGVLRWDSHLTDYVPSFQLATPDATSQVTVADILSHRTGLTRNAFDRDLEGDVDYHSLTQRMANAPMACAPGQCYAYQNVAFSLIGDIVFATTGKFYSESVASRIFKPLGMHDASYGLEGIEASASWAKPHVRGRGGWVSLMPKPNYYRVAPAAGVNASISDMAQWLIAHSGHRPDVLPAPLLATLHAPLIDTPSEIRGSSWRRGRLTSASYALGWRDYNYAGHNVIFHGGAVQGYRGMMALLPEQDMGVVILWNSESPLPSGLMPTILDAALGLPDGKWLDDDTVDGSEDLLYADRATPAGTNASRAKASPP
ncbi:serine hydrolase domain-containing protein [Thermomonas paludicola]|uniref:serine hydrolase domain-containing protein n=1 Tax=Thermomonas paludicola TaxID=2884874 RepID=UPI002115C1FA|nr:serine hydrolase domain-containing protein [Thermomonas paludicola]